jgi:hypothetical protein
MTRKGIHDHRSQPHLTQRQTPPPHRILLLLLPQPLLNLPPLPLLKLPHLLLRGIIPQRRLMGHHPLPLLTTQRHALIPAESGLLDLDLRQSPLLKGGVGGTLAAAGAAVQGLVGGWGGADGEGVERVVDAAGV